MAERKTFLQKQLEDSRSFLSSPAGSRTPPVRAPPTPAFSPRKRPAPDPSSGCVGSPDASPVAGASRAVPADAHVDATKPPPSPADVVTLEAELESSRSKGAQLEARVTALRSLLHSSRRALNESRLQSASLQRQLDANVDMLQRHQHEIAAMDSAEAHLRRQHDDALAPSGGAEGREVAALRRELRAALQLNVDMVAAVGDEIIEAARADAADARAAPPSQSAAELREYFGAPGFGFEIECRAEPTASREPRTASPVTTHLVCMSLPCSSLMSLILELTTAGV